jgi:uncharacterized beta-barrel protein YwiB (DUF1934 family)
MEHFLERIRRGANEKFELLHIAGMFYRHVSQKFVALAERSMRTSVVLLKTSVFEYAMPGI